MRVLCLSKIATVCRIALHVETLDSWTGWRPLRSVCVGTSISQVCSAQVSMAWFGNQAPAGAT